MDVSVKYRNEGVARYINHPMDSLENEGAIVRNIASFLSLSDAASFGGGIHHRRQKRFEETVSNRSSYNINTPKTPGLVTLSPDEYFDEINCDLNNEELSPDSDLQNSVLSRQRLRDRQRQLFSDKLAAAIFSHPQSLRRFCMEAHQATIGIKLKREARRKVHEPDPETLREPDQRSLPFFVEVITRNIMENLPLSVFLNLIDVVHRTILDTTFAVFTISLDSISSLIDTVINFLRSIWMNVCQIKLHSASEVLVSGIQSVATSVGSAAIQILPSRSDEMNQVLSNKTGKSKFKKRGIRDSLKEVIFINGVDNDNSAATNRNQQLIEKLSVLNSAARVIAYQERGDEVLTKKAKKKVKRMMHYNVSLRPFMATVQYAPSESSDEDEGETSFPPSPQLYSPKSFPPTPVSRSLVMAQGIQFSDDVVYLARDKLRIEDGLDSENERTRAMALALQQASRLAVLNAADKGDEIILTCGQHVATKIGSTIPYCSTRSMVPILRNCYAYFEMLVLPTQQQSGTGVTNSCNNNIKLQQPPTALSIGLSTLDMPINTLVGAWKGSVGLCTTGQVLSGGQWFSPEMIEPKQSTYDEGDTVGCLIFLDDNSAFETWDGVMVEASITFNINGKVVAPRVMGERPMLSSRKSSFNSTGSSLDDYDTTDESAQHLRSLDFDALRTTLSVLVPMEEELFPTLTLHSPESQVMCRFSAGDIKAKSCEQIGAPKGTSIYTVDGSILFRTASEDERRK